MRKHTILCVDDEPNVLSSLYRLLYKEGYNVITAGSAEEALKKLEEAPVDLIISDQRMPGVTGVQLLNKVKEKYPDTIRCILTAYADIEATMAAINEGGVYRFIVKPWNDEDLKMNIRLCLEHSDALKKNKLLAEKLKEQNRELREKNAALEGKNLQITEVNKNLQTTKELLEKKVKIKNGQFLIDQYETRVPARKFRERTF